MKEDILVRRDLLVVLQDHEGQLDLEARQVENQDPRVHQVHLGRRGELARLVTLEHLARQAKWPATR